MAIISSYTIGTPTLDDYLIGTDDPGGQGPTKNFTLQSIYNHKKSSKCEILFLFSDFEIDPSI